MTLRKHFKQLVRERMSKTGESYTSARRHLLKAVPKQTDDTATRWHFAGSIPGATCLRVLLNAAGVRNPQTDEPFSEAMAFGIAGGVGIGVASFRYEKEDFSSFFLAGRHLWYDDLSYLQNAIKAIGLDGAVHESGSVKAAEKQLRAVLANGPCVAWVDMALLPHRGLPPAFSGGGYHVMPLYRIDDDAHTVIAGDLTDQPLAIPLADLAAARARIKKQANRLLTVRPANIKVDLAELIRHGLRTCHRTLTAKPGKGPLAMSTLTSLKRWRDRLTDGKDKECWRAQFPLGVNLWRGLTWINLCIEWYGTGGGLCRHMMADFLGEAGDALGDDRYPALADGYRRLGHDWSALADAALHDGVPIFREAKRLHARYAELFTTNGPLDDKLAVWRRLDELAAEAKSCFPLSESQAAELRAALHSRVARIVDAEEKQLINIASLVS